MLQRIAASAHCTSPLPRLLIVLAHPDDEVLAMGARLERLAHSCLLTVTDGAPADGADARHHGFPSLESYRRARQEELTSAFADAGLSLADLEPLSAIAPIPVPDQAAAFHLPELTRAIVRQIADFRPEAVLTHPYEGGHPDHDACAFAVHTALHMLGNPESNAATTPRAPMHPNASPLVVEAPFYHAGDDGSMRTGQFLANPQATEALTCDLSPQEAANKRARLACFSSQMETLAQFQVDQESFRLAPPYDFTRPPHPGQLFYERFSWGITGNRFCLLAAQALDQLFGRASAPPTSSDRNKPAPNASTAATGA